MSITQLSNDLLREIHTFVPVSEKNICFISKTHLEIELDLLEKRVHDWNCKGNKYNFLAVTVNDMKSWMRPEFALHVLKERPFRRPEMIEASIISRRWDILECFIEQDITDLHEVFISYKNHYKLITSRYGKIPLDVIVTQIEKTKKADLFKYAEMMDYIQDGEQLLELYPELVPPKIVYVADTDMDGTMYPDGYNRRMMHAGGRMDADFRYQN